MHVENRLPKNQWLIHRRICSLPDNCKKPSISLNKSHLSANETNRLDINHWFFGRRFFFSLTGHNAPIEHFDVSRHQTDLMP